MSGPRAWAMTCAIGVALVLAGCDDTTKSSEPELRFFRGIDVDRGGCHDECDEPDTFPATDHRTTDDRHARATADRRTDYSCHRAPLDGLPAGHDHSLRRHEPCCHQ